MTTWLTMTDDGMDGLVFDGTRYRLASGGGMPQQRRLLVGVVENGLQGEPTRAAIRFGLIDADWSWQLADETEADFAARMQAHPAPVSMVQAPAREIPALMAG